MSGSMTSRIIRSGLKRSAASTASSAVGRGDHLEPGVAEAGRQQLPDVRFVVDDQEPGLTHWFARILGPPPPSVTLVAATFLSASFAPCTTTVAPGLRSATLPLFGDPHFGRVTGGDDRGGPVGAGDVDFGAVDQFDGTHRPGEAGPGLRAAGAPGKPRERRRGRLPERLLGLDADQDPGHQEHPGGQQQRQLRRFSPSGAGR